MWNPLSQCNGMIADCCVRLLFLLPGLLIFCGSPTGTLADPAANDVIAILDEQGQLHTTPLHVYLGGGHRSAGKNTKAHQPPPQVEIHMEIEGADGAVRTTRIPMDLSAAADAPDGNNEVGMGMGQVWNLPTARIEQLLVTALADGGADADAGNDNGTNSASNSTSTSNPAWMSGKKIAAKVLVLHQTTGIGMRKRRARRSVNATTTRSGAAARKTLEIPFNVYLWQWMDKLVVSDIDGTITRVDLMDVLFPSMDWTQHGTKSLYNNIANQGYRLIYLSARPLSMAGQTQQYLTQIGVPKGPVLLSPHSVLANIAVMTEPTEYKTNYLNGVKELFPHNARPFQAGLGNADTDKQAYEHVQMPYIFIVNPEGEVQVHYGQSETNNNNTKKLELDDDDDDGQMTATGKTRDRRGKFGEEAIKEGGDENDGDEQQQQQQQQRRMLMMATKSDYSTLAQNVQVYFPKVIKTNGDGTFRR